MKDQPNNFKNNKCIIEELKEIRKSLRKLDDIDLHTLLGKLIKNPCCDNCLLRKQLKTICPNQSR
jgi:hypothetical protein